MTKGRRANPAGLRSLNCTAFPEHHCNQLLLVNADRFEGSAVHITTIGNANSTAASAPVRGASAPSEESARIRNDVDAARNTALSALNNDRFRVMLEQITDPGASGALMTMGADGQGGGVDFNTAQSRYAENSK
jgi:hypothetical protein